MINWEAVGALAELAGAMAVVATLFYLASQIKQSNVLARRSEHNATMNHASQLRMEYATNPELVSLNLKGAKDYSQLNEVERVRFDNLQAQTGWHFVQIWDRNNLGFMDEEMWTALKFQYSTFLSGPGARKWWERNKLQFPTEFIAEIEGCFPAESQRPE